MPISEAQRRAQKKYYEKNRQAIIEERNKNCKKLTLPKQLYFRIKELAVKYELSMAKFIESLLTEK